MNLVEISGTVSQEPSERVLADDRTVLNWRIKVLRDESGSDSVPCVLELSQVPNSVITKVRNLEIGQSVAISGQIRSRFWQSGGASSSRLEVEVHSLKKVSKQNL